MIFETITEIYMTLTKAEKKIADYIYENKESAQYMSITSLADECQVAEATITRFCKKLGVSGYNALKLAIARGDTSEENGGSREPKDNMDLKKVYLSEVKALKETYEQLSDVDIDRAAHYLHSAQRVYCMGVGGSSVIAMEAWARFVTVSTQFQWIQDCHFQAVTASLCNINDVILYFSYSGSTRDIIDILKLAREKNAKVILVTKFPDSPAAQYADITLICAPNESPLQSGSIAAKISQLYIIDILFNTYCKINPQYTNANRDITARVIADRLM
ncbi:MAG: MurR/RpiR family transcriptional regulator [Oscillospiraceae bacterium]|nr:MurR/RpiR family transcriptional regulator [Oscillospiraceae bacterium]